MIANAAAAKATAVEQIARLLGQETQAAPAVWPNSTMALAITARELRKTGLAAANAARH